MGNWNRRYLPRKNFRHYDYEDPPSSPPMLYNNLPYHSGVEDNRLPSWEIDYCKSARVPWNKVLASKKYIYCYPSVLNWDACAGKEALENAKQRYWSMINGIPCDNSLPDPDMYIDEINWNPYIDPELMADLDHQFHNPEEAQMVEKLETINEEVGSAQRHYDKNKSTSDNPWEMNCVQSTASLIDPPSGWPRWDDSVNLKNDNPWEQSCSQVVDSSNNNVWRSNAWPSASVDIRQTVAARQEEWGCRENNSWSWNNENGEKLKNVGSSCKNNYSIGSKDRGWRDNKNESWGWGDDKNESWDWRDNKNESWGWRDNKNESWRWRDNKNESWGWRDNKNESWGWRAHKDECSGWRGSENQGDEHKYRDSRSFRQGVSSFRGGCRKREISLQHNSRYKSSRYQGGTYGDSKQF